MAPELTSESVPEVTSHRSGHERSEDQSARLGMCKMRQRVTNSDLPSGGWWESSDLWSCRQCWGQSAPTGGAGLGTASADKPASSPLSPQDCSRRCPPGGRLHRCQALVGVGATNGAGFSLCSRPAIQPQGSTSCKLALLSLLFRWAPLGAQVLLPSSVGRGSGPSSGFRVTLHPHLGPSRASAPRCRPCPGKG